MNGILNCILSEQKNIIIGNENLFSFDIWLRVADPHLIYDVKTNKRINYSKSIYIGDHVWIGQHAMTLKGAKLGSGSILGALAVTSATLPSNCIMLGNPATIKRKNIFWDSKCVHNWISIDTKNYEMKNSNLNIYTKNSNLFYEIENNLSTNIDAVEDKYEYIKSKLALNDEKNRFAIVKKKNKFIGIIVLKNRVINKLKRSLCKKKDK